jgi:DNA topoisomerase-1
MTIQPAARDQRPGKPSPGEDRRHPALHRAAAALFGSLADQEDGRARHRPAVDLCIDADDAARPRICESIDKKLIPEAKGRLVIAFLENFFERYVEFGFTATWRKSSTRFPPANWQLEGRAARLLARVLTPMSTRPRNFGSPQVLDALNEALAPLVFPAREDGSDPRICPTCGTGNLSLKLGKYGAFVGCSNYPECNFTRQLCRQEARRRRGVAAERPKDLGKDPYTEEPITCAPGRFGPYVQRGEGKEAKRSSLPKGWSVDSIDHEKALALLSLPRDVGQHPESGKMISAGIGRYGPFVLHDGTYANLESVEDVFSIGLNRAVTVIAEKHRQGSRARTRHAGGAEGAWRSSRRSAADHRARRRYGPYVNWGKINATCPRTPIRCR